MLEAQHQQPQQRSNRPCGARWCGLSIAKLFCAAQWGAVDLADTDAVTGVLPIGNQADQTMAGDVSGSTGSSTCRG